MIFPKPNLKNISSYDSIVRDVIDANQSAVLSPLKVSVPGISKQAYSVNYPKPRIPSLSESNQGEVVGLTKPSLHRLNTRAGRLVHPTNSREYMLNRLLLQIKYSALPAEC
jgi:hypothetical protein